MTYTMRQDTSRASDPDLITLADSVHHLIATLAEDQDLPDVEVDLVWTTDFVTTTQQVLNQARPKDGWTPSYTAKRLGGEAVAKNIAMTDDSSHVTIVVNRNALSAADVNLAILAIFTLAHELTHPLINRMRAASGVLSEVQFPSWTPREITQSITREAVDEYWTDCIAGLVLGGLAFAERDGERIPLHQGHVHEGIDGYRRQLADVLDSHIYPGWPNLVEAYLNDQLSLDDMWRRIVMETNQIFTLLAHGQACADGDSTHRSDQLVDGAIGDHQGVQLYLGPAWNQILDNLGGMPLGLGLEDFAASDRGIAEAGEDAIKGMWEILGLTFDEREDRSYHIHVTEPAR